MNLSFREKASYGLGAVGKDMVYMLSASYVLYYYQDVMGVSAFAMGIILLIARIFDAFNDPIMGVIVAKTQTKWGKFRPWLMIGTLTNAVLLFLMFSAPASFSAGSLTAYAAITYIMWGVTYTMMDIPYWSMIPAFTESGRERENLTTLARSAAGVGSALVMILTMKFVYGLGNIGGDNLSNRKIEMYGFKWFALIVAIIFIVFITITCMNIKEKSTVNMKTASVSDMFKALLSNDQAMTIVVTIVLINCAVYITSNLVIYFFKYDFGGESWFDGYTLFNTFGGGIQILAMMLFFPLLRKFFNTIKMYYICIISALLGYAALFAIINIGIGSVYVTFIPAFFIFAANGMLQVLTTIFLANTVDYGEIKNSRRDESVIFSMQTFVVKLASGIAAFVASISLSIFSLSSKATTEAEQTMDLSKGVSDSSKIGLRMTMTILPIIGLIIAVAYFKKKYILTDEKIEEISKQIKDRRQQEKE